MIGSRPDGWWRDRAGAAERLATQLAAALDAGRLDADVVHLVLEGAAQAAEVPDHPRMRVVRAVADGDGTIVDVVAELAGGLPGGTVTVVTADRGLRARLTAPVVGPGTLLAHL